MRHLVSVIIVIIALICGYSLYGGKNPSMASNSSFSTNNNPNYTDSDYDDEDSDYCEEDTVIESLNDIRFADFEYEDWFDNGYIRALRQYLDDFTAGKIEDETLEPYKAAVKGKFVIASVEPALMGGLYISFTFIDQPKDIFSTWVYSEVNETTRKVTSYSVNGIQLTDTKNDIPREKILKIVEERPELKLF